MAFMVQIPEGCFKMIDKFNIVLGKQNKYTTKTVPDFIQDCEIFAKDHGCETSFKKHKLSEKVNTLSVNTAKTDNKFKKDKERSKSVTKWKKLSKSHSGKKMGTLSEIRDYLSEIKKCFNCAFSACYA